MATRKTQPKEMARKLVRILRSQRPDYFYLKKVFRVLSAIRTLLANSTNKELMRLIRSNLKNLRG